MIRNIIGYEGLYVVDDEGNIFSVRSNKYLAPVQMESGYLYAHLFNEKHEGKLIRIHRIVAEAYLDNPYGFTQVNHKNGNKKDNRVCNLEWCSSEQNMQHAITYGLFITSGEKNPSAKLNWKQVKEIRREYIRRSKEYGTTALAKKYGVSNTLISMIVRGKCWKEGFDTELSNHRKEGDV